jgi:hypothetical protein
MRSLLVISGLIVACFTAILAQASGPQDSFTAAKAALQRCDAWLNMGENGPGWRKHLRFDAIQSELEKGSSADAALLDEVIGKLNSGAFGTEMPEMQSLRAALVEWRLQLGTALPASHQIVLSQAPAPMPENSVIAPAASLSATPNFYARVSGRFLGLGLDRDVNECTPLTDCILGTSINGTVATGAHVQFALVPNSNRAQFDVMFTGTAYSNTVGSNRSALIYTTGSTQLVGHKPIVADFGGLYDGGCATAWANTCTSINCTGSTKPGLRGRIVSKIAAKKAGKSKAEAESIASNHAEERLRKRLEETMPNELAQSNQRFQSTLIQPLTQRGLLPHNVLLGTTSQHLYVCGVESSPGQAGGSGAPTPLTTADLGGQVHEGLLANVLAPRMAGRKMNDEDFRKLVIDLLGRLPEGYPPTNPDESFEVQFPDGDPVTSKFENDSIFITVHGKSFEADKDRKIAEARITAEYKIARTPSGIRLLLQEEPGNPAKPGADHKNFFAIQFEKSTLRSTADKAVLRKKLLKVFREEIILDLAVAGNWQSLGKLPVTEAAARYGWLTLGWSIPSYSSAPMQPTPAVPMEPMPTVDLGSPQPRLAVTE